MKRTLLVLGAIFSLFATGCFAQNQPQTIENLPRPSEQKEIWDFGRMKEGLQLKHDFILKNKSERVLNITGTNTSCGCTVSKVGKNMLLPGEETSIEVYFNSVGYSGPIQQYIYVNTDNTQEPVLKFTIKAEVIKSTEGPYATWDFGRVKEGKIAKHNFVVKNKSPKTINILEVRSTCGCTGTKIQKNTLLPGESTFLEVQFNTKGYSKSVEKSIYVQADDLENPLLRFIIKAEVIK